jgi:predicted CXXCH cytochrome family protein
VNKLLPNQVALTSGAILVLAGGQAVSGIANTKHDLAQRADTTEEICVFCHTPHGAVTQASVPLWNKGLRAGSYLPSTGTVGVAVTPGSVTVACLSCHDGAQATDVLINAPGSGGYTPPPGAQLEPARFEPLTGNDVICQPNTPCDGHHPISVQYGGGGALASDPDGPFTGTLGLPDFTAPVKATTNNGLAIWWVDSVVGATGTREKTDMALYTRTDLGTAQPFVECGSCHDPHTDEVNRFLRNEDQICTTCHVQ